MEFVNAFAHYYRAEMQRAISWRDRLDRTTNWAIAGTAGILSVSLNQPEKHHGLLLFGMALVLPLLLVIESRRYPLLRCVSQAAVRIFETHYYANVMAPQAGDPDAEWLQELGDNIRTPVVVLTMREAMAQFGSAAITAGSSLVILAAWLLKVAGSIAFLQIWAEALGSTPAKPKSDGLRDGAILLGVLGFYAWLAYIMVRYRGATQEAFMREV